MTRLRFHSDCDYFAGCETMLANFFADERLARDFNVSFSYRASTAYDKGLRERVGRPPRLVPLGVLDFHQVSGVSNSWPAPLRAAYKALLRLALAKYWILLWDVGVIYRSLASDPVDILHINNGGFPGAVSCAAAAAAGRLRGVKKIVYVVNNQAVPYDGPDRWLDWPLDRLAVRCVDIFATASVRARLRLIRVLGLPESKVLALPNGIAPRGVHEGREAVRQRLGVPSGRPMIAVVAVLETRKGHRVLLEALKLLKSEGLSPMPVTVLAGDGPLRGELEEITSASGLEKDIVYLGWESRQFDLFNAADVVALPSIADEDMPNVIVEAMSLGKAVAATRVGGTEEQIVDGESGVLVEPGSASDLARGLKKLCVDPELRSFLGNRARERYEERFTASVSVERYLKLYRSL
ncbi:MAG: glycosyltransferase family 4 protein [Elusimicrobiota bacterium]